MIELHNMDCMDYMRTLPDKAFELAIVDPPYGIDAGEGIGRSGRKNIRKQGGVKDWDAGVPNVEYFQELKRVSGGQIIWGGNYFQELDIYNPKAKRLSDFRKLKGIVWDKGATMYGRDFSEAEIAYSTVGEGWFKLSPIQSLRIHPTQKPVALYKWLLHHYASPGDRILDTHLGSGSIAIACHDMKFDLVGCELDKDYYEAACKRLRNHQMQQTLF